MDPVPITATFSPSLVYADSTAKMSAAATVSALPVIVARWVSQGQIVHGLTAGAIK